CRRPASRTGGACHSSTGSNGTRTPVTPLCPSKSGASKRALRILENALRHEDDVSGLEPEVLLAAGTDVRHRDADLRLLALDLAGHGDVVLAGDLGEATGHGDGLDDRHVLLVGERARLLDLAEDEDLLAVVLTQKDGDLGMLEVLLPETVGQRVCR